MKSYSYECSLKTMKDTVSYEVRQAFVIVIGLPVRYTCIHVYTRTYYYLI